MRRQCRELFIHKSTPQMTPEAVKPNGGHDQFVLEIIAAQSRLYAYILSLVLDRDKARDILQQTNLVLLEKEREFEWGTNFGAWASRVAYFEVLTDRRTNQRDRHLFSDELLSLIAVRVESDTENMDERTSALRDCFNKLTEKQRQLIENRYGPGGSVAELSKSVNKTPGAISAMLYRIRSSLADCIERRLGGRTIA